MIETIVLFVGVACTALSIGVHNGLFFQLISNPLHQQFDFPYPKSGEFLEIRKSGNPEDFQEEVERRHGRYCLIDDVSEVIVGSFRVICLVVALMCFSFVTSPAVTQ